MIKLKFGNVLKGILVKYSLQTCFQADFKAPKGPLSNGCAICVEFGGKQNTILDESCNGLNDHPTMAWRKVRMLKSVPQSRVRIKADLQYDIG